MRTFAIIVGTLLVVLAVGFGGYLIGWGVFWKTDAISAEVNPSGDLEITARDALPVQIIAVRFNDKDNIGVCTSRPQPIFYTRDWRYSGNWLYADGSWQSVWERHVGGVTLNEGDIAIAPFYRAACGEKIIKAEVVTNLKTYVFRYPHASKVNSGRTPSPSWLPLEMDRWYVRP